MEVRATLRPGQKGTRKLLERYGARLVCVRYLYDSQACQRHITVELIVDSAEWKPNQRNARRRDDDIVAVRIAYHETDLRERAKRLGALWRPAQKRWEITWRDANPRVLRLDVPRRPALVLHSS